MDRFDVSPPSHLAHLADAGADDVAPLSVVRPGKRFQPRTSERPLTVATSFARVRTERARDYLGGLDWHWHRHVQVVRRDDAHLEIVFPLGHAELDASSGTLEVNLAASSNHDAAVLEDLLSESLDRLAFGEDLQYQWIRPAPRATRDAPASQARPRNIFSFPQAERVMHLRSMP